MQVLIIGQGSREHALAWKISQSPLLEKIYFWPGNPAMLELGTALDLPADADFAALERCLLKDDGSSLVDLVLCGPEKPLADGLADRLDAAGIPVFGPSQAAAMLEASKSFAKDVMQAAGIPTAGFKVCKDRDATQQVAMEMLASQGGAVLKASGLAGGKGVFVCTTEAEIESGLRYLYETGMKSAAEEVVVEELLRGRECSYFTMLSPKGSDGIGFAVDFKRRNDGDAGPNTGGMGSYTPVPWLPANAGAIVEKEVVAPLMRELESRGIKYRGWLYVGLMWSEQGPKVVEFNVRLGDPEAQLLVAADSRDWLPGIGEATGLKMQESRGNTEMPFRHTVGVVMASRNYPFDAPNPADSCALSHGLLAPRDASMVFAAAVGPGEEGVVTKSGRVLTVVGVGDSFELARKAAYDRVGEIEEAFPTCHYRSDIASKVVIENS